MPESRLGDLDAARERRAERRQTRFFWRVFTEAFHPPVPVAKPDFLGSRLEKQSLFIAQFPMSIARRDDFDTNLRRLGKVDLSALFSSPFFGNPGDINSFNSLAC